MKILRLAVLTVLVLGAGCAHQGAPVEDKSANTLGNPPGMVDQLVMIDNAEELGQGTRVGVSLVRKENGGAELVMDEPGNREYPRRGSWTSEEIEGEMPFTELIPSWNVSTPANTGLWLFVRVKMVEQGQGGGSSSAATRRSSSSRRLRGVSGEMGADGWSPWLYMGYWGRTLETDKLVGNFDWGRVNVDNLILKKPASAFQVRVDFQSFDTDVKVNPSVRRVAISYSGVVADAEKRKKLSPTTQVVKGKVDIAVPYRPQGDNGRALKGQTCSPTSTSMVLAYWGADRPTLETCVAMWDNDNEMFGNWGRAVARAGEMGLDAWIDRFRDWDHVKAVLARGEPVIASIKFKKGEFPSSLLKDGSTGHLVVIRGMTENGDVICNDPGSRAKGNGVVYKADELGRAWFGHGGVAYIIKGKSPVVAKAK